MPTNLPPEYFEVERRYKAAASPEEKINLLEELIGTIPKHKGTDKLRADLRRKLSKLKAAAQAKKKTGRQESVYHIEREGAGRVVLVGMPNVGKSSLVAVLTNAEPKVSESPYSTWAPTPGMMRIGNIQVQLIDTPPLNREHTEPQLMELIRGADLLLIVLDLQDFPIQQLDDTIEILRENRLEICSRKDEPPEATHGIFKPLIVVNKHDDRRLDEEFQVFRELFEEEWAMIPLSAKTGRNIDRFKQAVFEVGDLRDCFDFEMEEMGRYPAFLDPLEEGIKELYQAMVDGEYRFGREDLPFMQLLDRHADSIPFAVLLRQINETHRKGIDVDPS